MSKPVSLYNSLVVVTLLLVASCTHSSHEADNWCDQPLRPAFEKLESVAVSGDWFKVFKAGEGVFAIAEPHNFQEVISYLVLGEEKALLFDSGMGMSSIASVVKQLTTLPVTVLNSHTHYDHIGGNFEFDDILAIDTDYTKNRAATGMAHSMVAHEVTTAAFCSEKLPDFDAGAYHIKPFAISQFVQDGSLIDLANRELQVIAVPGHTPDAIALLDTKNGYLFTGDSFYEAPIWLFDEGTDLDAYQAGIQKMADLNERVKMLFPAHNTPTAPSERLNELVDAFGQIMDGTKQPEPNEQDAHTDSEAMTYHFEHFSFIIRRDALQQKGLINQFD